MINRDLNRAKNAWDATLRLQQQFAQGRDEKLEITVKKVPGYILDNGLLAAIAYCMSKSDFNEREDYYTKCGLEMVCDEVARHLAEDITLNLPVGGHCADDLLSHLRNSNSECLRRCTSEAIGFLSYLRRFANNTQTE